MGLFSRLFSKVYDIRSLNEEQLFRLVSFFERGWALEARRYANMEGPLDVLVDKNIAKGLRKGCLTGDELDTVIALLLIDQKRYGEDDDTKVLVRELRYIRDNDVLYIE